MVSKLSRQLVWYIALRLVVVVSVLLSDPVLGVERGAASWWLFPGLPVFVATLVYIALLRLLRRRAEVHAYLQFVGDLWLVTGLIYWQGGIPNPLSLLYLLVITVASTLLRRRAGVQIAALAFLFYALLGWKPHLLGWIYPFLTGIEIATPSSAVLYPSLLIHGIGFLAMAMLTSHLARRASRAERELEEKSEDLADLQVVHRDIVESITSGLLTTDLAGVVTSANQAGLAILAANHRSLVGASIEESGLFSAAQWRELIRESAIRGKLRSEVEIERGSDTAFIGFSVSPLTDAFGAHKGYIVIFQDLTRWRKMQEDLRLKDRMVAVGELAAGLAHEIGNPLAAISGSVQMLVEMVDSEPPQKKLLEILVKESQRLDRTIKGFLRFARPRERSASEFDVSRLLAENFELLRNSEEVTGGHRLELDLDPPAARLYADPDQVSQIFWNLARNALRAMPDGGTLRVVGRLAGEAYRMQVIDSGRGMTEEQRANLFHPFQSFFDGGTGIGMAIVYRIVQEHGGRLQVDSRPGGGTTITVELPTARASRSLVSAEVGV